MIGICQIDGKIPNLALMKVTGFYEKQGIIVEQYNSFLSYEKVYASKIFSFSQMPFLPEGAIIGGTGIDFYNKLPDDIEQSKPSYSLYPICDYHIGFSMKDRLMLLDNDFFGNKQWLDRIKEIIVSQILIITEKL